MKEEYNKLDAKQRNLMEQLDEILEEVDAVRDGKLTSGNLRTGFAGLSAQRSFELLYRQIKAGCAYELVGFNQGRGRSKWRKLLITISAPVAQLDRASAFEAEGREFDLSGRATLFKDLQSGPISSPAAL